MQSYGLNSKYEIYIYIYIYKSSTNHSRKTKLGINTSSDLAEEPMFVLSSSFRYMVILHSSPVFF